MIRLSNRVRAQLLDLEVGRCCLDRLDRVLHFDNELSERMKQIEYPMIAMFRILVSLSKIQVLGIIQMYS